MKKALSILLVAMSVILMSCGSDSKDEPNNSSIVGVWYETEYWDGTKWHTWGIVSPRVHEFSADKTYKKFNTINAYRQGDAPSASGTYKFDGKYLIVDGGYKRAVVFSDDGNRFTWEETAKCKRM